MKIFLLFVYIFTFSVFGQQSNNNNVPYNTASFQKGLPEEIPFKMDKATYARIECKGFYKSIFIVCKDTTQFLDKLFISVVFLDSTFSFNSLNKDHISDDTLRSTINLTTKEEDELHPLNLNVSANRTVKYNWGFKGNYSISPSVAKEYELKPGAKFPNFKLKGNTGYVQTKKFIGKVLVINWWATSCIPCIEEIPGLNKLVDRYNNVVFLSVLDGDPQGLSEFLKQHEFNYIHTYSNKEILEAFGGIYPRNIIIDKFGKIAHNERGGSKNTYVELDSVIQRLIN